VSSTSTPTRAESAAILQNAFDIVALGISKFATDAGLAVSGKQGHQNFIDFIQSRAHLIAEDEIAAVILQPPTKPIYPTQVSFCSISHDTQYDLTTPRQSEFVRRILDNAEFLDKDSILTDLLKVLLPFHDPDFLEDNNRK
jgi:hypothetical protein